MLSVQGLEAGYGDSRVLFGVGFAVNAGEVVTLLGRNGMGKTTTVLTVMGIIRSRAGEVWLDGTRLDGQPPYRVARAGLGLVPEGRQVFPNLTVRENLTATAAHRSAGAEPWILRSVLDLFPPRRASVQPRRPPVRRRAADAGDRARVDDQPAPAHS